MDSWPTQSNFLCEFCIKSDNEHTDHSIQQTLIESNVATFDALWNRFIYVADVEE
ncbi:hypothetical protein PISMIDRAFT_15076 [Pisolithus microcarpus 441]|uniref:Unplaced genomic scaffold scaffold_143, whole genome shotgun sequence n=1 Tax=Pisolithus microcarpus 441 TaxID=765257 RepID=A0A0C9XY99_9AGAM|nr:hypothetical protein PISMIDRAFT_15076 [Pisolithus microcarpus 441]